MPRSTRRFLLRIPLRFRPLHPASVPEQTAESMNLSIRGVYFATDFPVKLGAQVQVVLKMPAEIVGEQRGEWCFTGRVAHVEKNRMASQKSGVGVQFLYYEVPRPGETSPGCGSPPNGTGQQSKRQGKSPLHSKPA